MAHNLTPILTFLRPLGAVYSLVMRLRAALFSSGWRTSHSFDVPVISIGNLTMGGSGKTPVVIHLTRFFLERGFKPAVVSRGYGGKASASTNVVSDGKRILLDCIRSGDEPRLIAEEVPQAVVLTGKKRKDPCRTAVENYGCDILILDDGFQHLAVDRDIDLVLFDNRLELKQLRVFPAGFLREPFDALERADGMVITGCLSGKTEDRSELQSFLTKRWPDKPVFQTNYVPHCLLDKQGNTYPLGYLNRPAFAFCGIASPHRFQETLAHHSIAICGFSHFSDHHQYSSRSLALLHDKAQKKHAGAFITTEKDLVKLKHLSVDLPLYALAMRVEIDPSFENFLIAKIHGWKTSLR